MLFALTDLGLGLPCPGRRVLLLGRERLHGLLELCLDSRPRLLDVLQLRRMLCTELIDNRLLTPISVGKSLVPQLGLGL